MADRVAVTMCKTKKSYTTTIEFVLNLIRADRLRNGGCGYDA